MSSYVPYGRAPGIKRNERIDADESLSSRARELPARDGWTLATLPMWQYTIDQPGLTANRLRLFYVGKPSAVTTLTQARVTISTASASQSVRTAIFIYDNSGSSRRLVKVPTSETVFSATSTGTLTNQLPVGGAEMQPGHMFIGLKASDDFLGVSGVASAGYSRGVPVLFYEDQAGSLPSSIETSQLTKNYTSMVLDVLYISPDAAQVL